MNLEVMIRISDLPILWNRLGQSVENKLGHSLWSNPVYSPGIIVVSVPIRWYVGHKATGPMTRFEFFGITASRDLGDTNMWYWECAVYGRAKFVMHTTGNMASLEGQFDVNSFLDCLVDGISGFVRITHPWASLSGVLGFSLIYTSKRLYYIIVPYAS